MKLKRIISSILAAAMSLTILPSIPAKAETGSKIYTYDGYQVEYTVQNEWTNNQSVQVTVTNTDDESILNWALKYDAKGEINGLWNGSVYKKESTSYIIKNAGYNYEIKPNQSVNLGYTLTGEALTAPDKFEMCTKRVDKVDGYTVAFNITNDWDTGFQGTITVNNISPAAIEGWMLSFDSNFAISDLWNGKVVSSNGTSYTVANEQCTNPIQPNSSVTIGFTAAKTAGTIAVAENFKLSEVAINETTSGEATTDTDNDDKIPQLFTYTVENQDCAIKEVSVSMLGTGNLQSTTTVKSVMGTDKLSSDVVGLIGEPFDIETTSKFDKAVLSFTVDQSKLGDTSFNDLMFLWYDETNNKYVELETVLDATSSTVSTTVTHFSRYMIVDRNKWFSAWSRELNYHNNSHAVISCNTVLAIDCSGSMYSADPITSSTQSSPPYATTYKSNRHTAARNFINSLDSNDRAAIIAFDDYAYTLCSLTSDKNVLNTSLSGLYSEGGTSFDDALRASIDELNSSYLVNRKYIILLSDGSCGSSPSLLTEAKKSDIIIHTIGLGSGSYDSALKQIASATGGEFFKVMSADQLVDLYTEIGIGMDFDKTDTDGDGLYDAVESAGIRLQNGQIINTDPTLPDTDFDGLLDGEEIDPTIRQLYVSGMPSDVASLQPYYFEIISDPRKIDTDNDKIADSDDEHPLIPVTATYITIQNFFDTAQYFEIRFMLENPWLQSLGTLKSISCIEICREFKDSANLDALDQKFIDAGLMKDNGLGIGDPFGDPAALLLAEYENYSRGTSFSEISKQAYSSWCDQAKLAATIWVFGASSDFLYYCEEFYASSYKMSSEEEKIIRNFSNYEQNLSTEINNVEMINSSGVPLGEFDGLDISNKIIYEDKAVNGLLKINPNTGKPQQTAMQWAKNNIYNKTVKRIENINIANGTKMPGNISVNSDFNIPTIKDIKSCNKFIFRLEGDSQELRVAMNEVINLLNSEYSQYDFEVIYNYIPK